MFGSFSGARLFNKDISSWNASCVIGMGAVFDKASRLNQDISEWDVSSVLNMGLMFADAASFNQDISERDVSSVVNLFGTFSGASQFDKDICPWGLSLIPRNADAAFLLVFSGTGCPSNPIQASLRLHQVRFAVFVSLVK